MISPYEEPRLARPDEGAACHRLSSLCFSGVEESAPPVEHRPPDGETYAFFYQSQPVAQISIFHERLRLYDSVVRVGSIGGVCTHPDHRGHGLASQLMEVCTRQLALQKASLMLISGSRGLYSRLGCVEVGIHSHFTLRPDQRYPTLPGITLRPITLADAALCSRIYHAEPVRFVRQIDQFAEAFLSQDGYLQSETRMIELSGQPVAYLFLGTPWEYHPHAGIRFMGECAGSRVAIAHALGLLLAQGSLQEIQVLTAWQDTDLTQLLTGLGGQPERVPLFDHTMRLINFPGLMAGLRPYIRARLSDSLRRGLIFEQRGPLLGAQGGDTCVIARQRDRLELDVISMTRLVLGDPTATPIVTNAPGVLPDILASLFPLPAFFPGLNYH